MTELQKSKLQERIEELEEFLKQLDEIRETPNNMLSPIAGILERHELESLKKIWENTEH